MAEIDLTNREVDRTMTDCNNCRAQHLHYVPPRCVCQLFKWGCFLSYCSQARSKLEEGNRYSHLRGYSNYTMWPEWRGSLYYGDPGLALFYSPVESIYHCWCTLSLWGLVTCCFVCTATLHWWCRASWQCECPAVEQVYWSACTGRAKTLIQV